MRRILAASGIALVVASPVSALDVTTCGVVVPPRGIAELRNDLSCAGIGVTLEARATLRLNGFRLSGLPPASSAVGVACPGPCTIEGGGGAIADLGVGVQHARGRLTLGDLEISNVEVGLHSTNRSSVVSASRLLVHDTSEWLVVTGKLEATDVTVRDSRLGMAVLRHVVATNVVAAGNEGYGIFSRRRVRGEGITLTGNATGLSANRIEAVNVTATGNDLGVSARDVFLADSSLTGNHTDLASARRPKLLDTLCQTSLRSNATPPSSWGVCSDD